jgi:hypothetical protein
MDQAINSSAPVCIDRVLDVFPIEIVKSIDALRDRLEETQDMMHQTGIN